MARVGGSYSLVEDSVTNEKAQILTPDSYAPSRGRSDRLRGARSAAASPSSPPTPARAPSASTGDPRQPSAAPAGGPPLDPARQPGRRANPQTPPA
eukprot:1195178-Prorocentrum_minimum.AAC.1